MASLTGQLVAETYKALLKLIDNDILTASEKQITDGFGGGSNVFIDSQGFLRANKYKITNGLATQFLKADGSLDSNAYLTSITGAQVITALGYTPVPTTRTITINGETHNLAADNSWTVGGTAAIWGNITGTLSNQIDLQNALNAKYNNPAGTISQYIRGDGTLATFPTMPGGLPTGGSAGQILAKIDATDYNTHWIDNYATQTKNEVKLGQTLTKGTPVYVSSANGTNIIVSRASNTSEALSSKTFGLLESGGATNDIVKCVTFGLIAGLDTSTAQAGDPVWLGVNGALIFGLANKPYAPAHLVYIGVVTRVQQNNGEIFVNIQNGFELKEIHDVYIADPANNHGLFYDIADGLWKNKSIASALGYTPQAQLSGTGFVKASGTTITYDNSTYLTTADAANTYQLLTNLSTDLTASATKYPSVNAVIAGLGTKLNLSGGTLTGNLTISNANPKLLLTDTDNNPDYSIQNADGTFKITDETNSADRFLIYSTGIGYYNGDFKANKLFVQGGLSTQFIKADGTLDSNTYLTAASLDGYLAKSGGTMTGDLNFYTLKTTRVGGNAYIRGSWQGTYWGIGAAATGHTIIIDQVDFSTGAYESITDVNLMLGTRTVVHSGNVATYALPISGGTVTGSITATSFVKSGGTSSQFLMADGSVTTLSSPVTGSGSAGYIPKWTTAANIGSSNIYDDGTSIGIAYSTPNKGNYGRTLTGAAFGSASFGFEAVGGTTTNGGLVGGLSFILSQNDSSRLVGSAIQSNLVGTTATNYGADLRFFAKADAGVIGEVVRMTSAGLRVYGTIVKDGGTASQFLKADGSVDSNTYVTGGPYLALSGGTMANTNIVNNLNADLLDGFHATKFAVGSAAEINSNAEINDNSRLNGMYRVNPGVTSAPYDSYWSLIEYGNVNNVVGQLASHFANGETYIRAYNSSWSAWRKLWDNVNLANPISGTGTTNYIPKWTSTSGLGNSLIYDNGTKVFIGTTTTNSISTGGLTLSNATSSSLVLYNGAVIGFIYGSSVAAGMAISSDKDMRFETGDGSGSNWPERMRLFQLTGNLRLGYGNSPADTGYKFDVNGTGRFQGSATINGSSSCLLVTDGTNNSFIGLASVGGAYGNGTIAGDIVVRGTNGISLTPGSGSLTALRIASNGDSIFSNIVDAGTFAGNPLNYIDGTNISANTRKYRAIHSRTNNDYATVGLDLSNTQPTNNIYSPIISFSSITSGNVYNCTYAAIWGQKTADEGSWAAGDLIFGTANPYGVTQRMRLLANGNFGVGTASPVKKLDIVATGEQLRIAYDTSGSVYTDFRNDSAGGLLVNTSSGYIIHYITGSPIMRMNANGNVLIGTSTDNGARLRVVGGTIDFAGDTRYGVARIYNASVGDMFGMEQVGSTQTGGGAATRIFTANSSGNFLSLGWYTNATSFNDALRISCTSGLATFNSIDTSGNRTSPFTAMIISSDNNSNPYNGSGTALLFRNRIYAGGPSPGGMQDGARIRSWINTNSSENLGTDLVFDVTTTGNGSLTQILRLSYNGGASFSANVTATAFFESSDFRLKTLIESNPIIDGIEKLEAKLYEKDGKIEIGYFAQDAELIMPYAVTKGSGGFLNLSYREVHTAKIARLEQRVAELEKQLNLN